MVESQDSTTEGFDPRSDLAQARAARDAFVGSIGYPPGYVAMSGAGAGLLVVGNGALAADDAQPVALRAVLWLAFGLGFVLIFAGLVRFERSNGVRVNGFRFAKRASVAYVAAFILITSAQVATGVWWAGLIGGPIAAGLTVAFLRVWLRDYRRSA